MGWLQNLIDRFKTKREQKLLNERNEILNYASTNHFDSLRVDVSGMNGKSREEFDLEEAVNLAKSGIYVLDLKDRFPNLTQTQLMACANLGVATKQTDNSIIENIGGTKTVISRMVQEAEKQAKSFNYMSTEAYRFMPNAGSIINVMQQEKREKDYRDSFRLQHPQRMTRLNQLYQGAIEFIGPYKNNIDRQKLLDYMNRRGYNIQVGGENPYIEDVDIDAVLSLAGLVGYGGNLKTEDLNKFGGPAKVLDEMSVNAKMYAKRNNYVMGLAGRFVNVNDTLANMPQVDQHQQEI